ncbi:MAG: hypothetical protein KAY32_17475 [Candidatus Eisenbacteria sp.]|nr:hypothetical protein [Candidatus Eisenbacteria bacterium]
MRKADLKRNHEPFDAAVGRYRGFMQKIINAQRVVASAQEKRDIAESVLIRLCANWESFVDHHLVGCVNRDHSKLSEFFGVTVPANPSWNLCHALLFGESFRDFRSFGDLKGFTKRILPQASNPFLAVSAAHTEKIDEVYAIRNYLSHYSSRARRSLHRVYKSKYQMTRFLEPGQFVLAYDARRLWSYFGAFEGASRDMKQWS